MSLYDTKKMLLYSKNELCHDIKRVTVRQKGVTLWHKKLLLYSEKVLLYDIKGVTIRQKFLL